MSAEKETGPPSDRAKAILRALVEHYIRDGSPVGSKKLATVPGLKLSSATIRNVMADLEALGFIASPHTSAGRIPTSKGYRFFVDTLVKLRPPGDKELSELQLQLDEHNVRNAKSLAESASSALSSLTSLAGIVTIPRQSQAVLRQIEFLPLSDRRVLAILIMNDSEVQNRILHVDRNYTDDELRTASNFLNDHFAGKDLRGVRAALLDRLSETRKSMNQMMIDAVAIAQKALDVEPNAEHGSFVMKGRTKLMDFHELSSIDKLKGLFEAFNQQQEILHLLDRSIAAEGVQIFIGEESGYGILDECSVVTAPYRVDNEIVGVLGVIGPTRMAYERVIPVVDLTARLLGSALNSKH